MSKQGVPYTSPYLYVTIQASKEMQKLSRALGLDPLSRKKLGIRITKPREVAKPDLGKEVPVPNPKPAIAADVRDALNGRGRPGSRRRQAAPLGTII